MRTLVKHEMKAVPTCGATMFVTVCGVKQNYLKRYLLVPFKERPCKRCQKLKKR